jgi:hypothetical protein
MSERLLQKAVQIHGLALADDCRAKESSPWAIRATRWRAGAAPQSSVTARQRGRFGVQQA